MKELSKKKSNAVKLYIDDRGRPYCSRFEYDESGLGKLAMYGYNCSTCAKNDKCKTYDELKNFGKMIHSKGTK